MDKETSQIMTDAEEVRAMTTGKGWQLVKSKLDERLLDLQNIHNLDLTNLESLGKEVAARKMASELIFAWLKQDVYGAVEARDTNIRHYDGDPSFIRIEGEK